MERIRYKTYYILNIETDYYFDGYFSETSCGWTALHTCAKEYELYQRAYNMVRRINKHYGRVVCMVYSF